MKHAHDLTFRSAMSDLRVAKDVLRHYLPDIIRQKINLDKLKLENGTFIDPVLNTFHTDILYSVTLVNSPSNEKTYIYTHIEHQSTNDPMISFRMLKYSVRIIERHLKNTGNKTLPLIIPILIYNGDKIFSDNLSVFDLFGEHKALAQQYMFNKFHLVDMNTIPDEEIRQHKWSCLLEMIFKHIRSRNIMLILEEMTEIFNRFIERKADDYVLTMLKYIIEKSSIKDRQKFLHWVRKNLPKKLEEKTMTLAEQWKQEGIEIGIQQARTLAEQSKRDGMQQGERLLIKRLLSRRFGSVPSTYLEEVDNADAEKLLELGDLIIAANTLDDIFKNRQK